MYSINQNKKRENTSKSGPISREHLIPKAFSIQDYNKLKTNKKQNITKVKININEIERDVNFTYLALPENLANVLAVRKDVFTLVNDHNFNHSDTLILLTPTFFKERLTRIYNGLEGNLNRWNRTWDQYIIDKSKLDHPATSQRMYLSKMDRRFLEDKTIKPEEFFELFNECNELSYHLESTDRVILDENAMWCAFTNSFKTNWINVATEFDFIDNKNKFLKFITTKFEEELNNEKNKKCKFYNNNFNRNQRNFTPQHNYHITNQQGSQMNYNPNPFNNNNNRSGECFFCGRTNHKIKDCRYYRNHQNNLQNNNQYNNNYNRNTRGDQSRGGGYNNNNNYNNNRYRPRQNMNYMNNHNRNSNCNNNPNTYIRDRNNHPNNQNYNNDRNNNNNNRRNWNYDIINNSE